MSKRAMHHNAGGNRLTLGLLLTIVALTTMALALGSMAGCGSDAADAATSQTTAAAETTAVTQAAATKTITDQAGRQVVVPDPITNVWCTSPMGTNLMYSLAPDMLVGWNITPTALEKEFIPEQYRAVTGLGGWYGKNTTGNVEEIIKRAPDVILDLGDLDEAAISEIERIQGLLNIPVLMIDGDLTASASALRYIGDLLGVQERAEELAAYCDDALGEAQEVAASLSETNKVRVYYAEGTEGLNTDPEGSMHTEVLELVGGANVAEVSLESDYGMSPVSLEQVLVWDPEVILVASDPAEESNVYQQITTQGQWSTVTAVKNKQVYQIPRGPFDWFDRPPCVARIIGVRWLGNLLYPDLYQYDIEAEVRAFYKVFYHMDLTDEQYQRLTNNAVRTK